MKPFFPQGPRSYLRVVIVALLDVIINYFLREKLILERIHHAHDTYTTTTRRRN